MTQSRFLCAAPLALLACLGLAACDSRPMHATNAYNPSAPENAGYTPRRGPNQKAPYAAARTASPTAPDEAMLREAFARNPSSADVAYIKTLRRPPTAREMADLSVVITRDLCGIPENQRMSPEGTCVIAP